MKRFRPVPRKILRASVCVVLACAFLACAACARGAVELPTAAPPERITPAEPARETEPPTGEEPAAEPASPAEPSAPTDVSVRVYQYDSLQISWTPAEGAEACRVYRYSAEERRFLPEDVTEGNNYIVYGLTPGETYEFQVTSLRQADGRLRESAPSAAVRGTAGGDVLNALASNAPLPMFTVIDDDTRDPYSVKLFHDVCAANGVRGCYAVVTSNFSMPGTDGHATLLDQLKAYDADGFDMLLHCCDHDARFLKKNRENGWNGYSAAGTASLAAQSIRDGLADMAAAGLGHPSYWVAPMGVHDGAIRKAARNAGAECLLSVANKAYVTKAPAANGWNRWYIPRVELYGTDGAYDPERNNHRTGRHDSDRIWNTVSDVKAQIDAAAADNAWVIICTHVYESEWYLPRITLTKNGSVYIAETSGAGLTASWKAGAAGLMLPRDSYTFVFDKRGGVTGWFFEEGSDPQDLADYGVTVTGTPVYRSDDPAADAPDRSAFFSKRFSDVIEYARSQGLTNVTFSEGYAWWKAVWDAQERADACHDLAFEAGTDPTCSAAGRRAHYACAVCGGRFADEGAHTLLTEAELTVPADGRLHSDRDGDGRCDLCGVALT